MVLVTVLARKKAVLKESFDTNRPLTVVRYTSVN